MIGKLFSLFCLVVFCSPSFSQLNLQDVTIVCPQKPASQGMATASVILAEEVQKRTGLHWQIAEQRPEQGAMIILSTTSEKIPLFNLRLFNQVSLPNKPESYRIMVHAGSQPTIWVEGKDVRGVLYGVGFLLLHMRYEQGGVTIPSDLAVAASPQVPIRGHQLGYRNTANSYDGWTPQQYDQYIRELVIFGVNSIENIPFQDQVSVHMPVTREEMNVKLSEICDRYEVDYWMWTPAEFDLNDQNKKKEALQHLQQLFGELKRLNAIFFPGGDPGHNSPALVMPYLAEVANVLQEHHPEAKIWMSMQGFEPEETEYVYNYIRKYQPQWLGGLVGGPSSPPLEEMRNKLYPAYALRQYPDITHTVRCQYPVSWWDPAFNFTLGREPINPQPYYYAHIFRRVTPLTDGFISYSDGAHDDLNKIVWSTLAWDAETDVRGIVQQYTNFFFGSQVAGAATDALLALEQNWNGPLAQNAAVEGTLLMWQKLEIEYPELAENWRWQMYLLRAYYDAYTRHRLLYETDLEQKANEVMGKADKIGSLQTIQQVLDILNCAVTQPVKQAWKSRIEALCESLFQSIRLQTSVERYHAKNPERGAVLDFVDHPLNNRWWLEDQIKEIEKLDSEAVRVLALEELARWENPGAGSYYDDIGNVAKSPHVIRSVSLNTDPLMEKGDNPGFDWWDNGYSRQRLSWQSSMRWPEGLVYHHLDTTAHYRVRVTGYGESLLRANGERLEPERYGKDIGEIKEYPVPMHLIKEGNLLLTWDDIDESHLNWRQHSRVTEVWLIKE